MALGQVRVRDKSALVGLVTGLSTLLAALGLACVALFAVLVGARGLVERIGGRGPVGVGGVGAELLFEGLDAGLVEGVEFKSALEILLEPSNDSGLTLAGQACWRWHRLVHTPIMLGNAVRRNPSIK